MLSVRRLRIHPDHQGLTAGMLARNQFPHELVQDVIQNLPGQGGDYISITGVRNAAADVWTVPRVLILFPKAWLHNKQKGSARRTIYEATYEYDQWYIDVVEKLLKKVEFPVTTRPIIERATTKGEVNLWIACQ